MQPEQPYDVVIVGGGPSGLAAARELARAGGRIALIEESSELGGNYFKRRKGEILGQQGDFRPYGSWLINEVQSLGVACLAETLVWGADGSVLWTSNVRTGEIGSIAARRILLATGAYERVIPFPGWTLPGVCTPGLALQMAHVDRVGVGRNVVLAGTGPFLLAASAALIEIGVKVSAVLEINRPYRPGFRALGSVFEPQVLLDLVRYLSILRKHHVPLRQGWRVLAAGGTKRVETVQIARVDGSTTEDVPVDALCVAYGFKPNSELAILLGCKMVVDPASGDAFPLTDAFGRTSIAEVFAAGELCGIAGANAAMTRGRLAAYAIMRDLGLRAVGPHKVGLALLRAGRLQAFAHALARSFPVPKTLYGSISDGTVVCRCESISAGQVRKAAAVHWNDIQNIKAVTRCGMGPCQSRECGHTIAGLVGAITGAAVPRFSVRMPIKPIQLPRAPA